jgi:hypothetical protein
MTAPRCLGVCGFRIDPVDGNLTHPACGDDPAAARIRALHPYAFLRSPGPRDRRLAPKTLRRTR